MAPEVFIVEVAQFFSTDQCLADPSLFKAVRDIVQGWQEKGLKWQYWGTTVEKPKNMYWVLFWESRAHAAAFAADPLYPEFVQKRQSLATTPVRSFHAPFYGNPQLCFEIPITEVDFYKTYEARIEETHELARSTTRHLQSLQMSGFTGSSFGVAYEDPVLAVYFAGWNSVEDHMRLGMEEGHEKLREEAEELLKQMSDLVVAHIAFKKHGA